MSSLSPVELDEDIWEVARWGRSAVKTKASLRRKGYLELVEEEDWDLDEPVQRERRKLPGSGKGKARKRTYP